MLRANAEGQLSMIPARDVHRSPIVDIIRRRGGDRSIRDRDVAITVTYDCYFRLSIKFARSPTAFNCSRRRDVGMPRRL